MITENNKMINTLTDEKPSYVKSFLGSLTAFKLHIVALLLGFIILYIDVITKVVGQWITKPHSYAQGALILSISVYMLWFKIPSLKCLDIRPAFAAGFTVLFIGCFMFYAGKLSETVTVYETSLVITLTGMVWFVFGTAYFKVLLLPIGYLIFIFPLFGTILGSHILFLQELSAYIGAKILSFTEMSVYLHGYFIELPHIILSVVEACSGINHIVSLVAIALPLGFFTNKNAAGKILLVVMAGFIGIFANGARVALIGIWTYYNPDSGVHGPADFLLISFIFIFGLVMLLLTAFILGKIGFNKSLFFPENTPKETNASVMSPKFNIATILTLALFVITGCSTVIFKPVPVDLTANIIDFPTTIGEWHTVKAKSPENLFEHVKPDSTLQRVYIDSTGHRINLYIGYFSLQDTTNEIFNSQYNKLMKSSEVERIFQDNTLIIEANRFIDNTGNNPKNGLLCYMINNKFYAERYRAKFATIMSILTKRKNNAAIIILTAQQGKNKDWTGKGDFLETFFHQAYPFLKTFLTI